MKIIFSALGLAAVAALSGCLTLSGDYVVAVESPDGQPIVSNVILMAHGSGIYTMMNAACAANPGAIVRVRDIKTHQELASESPKKCPGTMRPNPTLTGDITGNTVADEQLRGDVVGKIVQLIKRQTSCLTIDKVGTINNMINRNVDGKVVKAEETWTAYACGKTFVYGVSMTPTKDGGTAFKVRAPN
ncbi:MAG: hypothetical protein LBH14_09375 [Desulfobulbaceae bacterium]|jgi:hypothetical protein|nr:hypothetical protein [Desulfobulbaceae bacterium]